MQKYPKIDLSEVAVKNLVTRLLKKRFKMSFRTFVKYDDLAYSWSKKSGLAEGSPNLSKTHLSLCPTQFLLDRDLGLVNNFHTISKRLSDNPNVSY